MAATGDRGEQLAGNYMTALGYEVIQYNYRSRYGEIDIVLQDAKYLVFLEVKLRGNVGFARAAEHVTTGKRRKFRTTSEAYLQMYPTEKQPRIDVLEIYAPNGLFAPLEFNLIENAF